MKDVLEPLLSRIAFLAAPSHTKSNQSERDRVSFKGIIAFCGTCKETYAAKTDLVIAVFEPAAKAGGALSIQRNHWWQNRQPLDEPQWNGRWPGASPGLFW